MKKKLYKVRQGKVLAGVCGGLAKYFDVNPKVVRWLFVLMCATFSSGLIIYIVLMIFMQKEPKAD
ncbi:PspC domain-containing protein [Lachnospiraceae bacterium 29-84]